MIFKILDSMNEIERLMLVLERTQKKDTINDSTLINNEMEINLNTKNDSKLDNSALVDQIWHIICRHSLFNDVVDEVKDESNERLQAKELISKLNEEIDRDMKNSINVSSLSLPLGFEDSNKHLERIKKDKFNRQAWQNLLRSIQTVPVTHCRNVWSCFRQLYPRSGHYISKYASLEVKHSIEMKTFQDRTKAVLRLIQLFEYHLPLCNSTELYTIFLKWIKTFNTSNSGNISKWSITWGIFPNSCITTCFEKAIYNVGDAFDSADLWLDYIQWKNSMQDDPLTQVKWTKGIYMRLLQTPLKKIEDIRTGFDNFCRTTTHKIAQVPESIDRIHRRVIKTLIPERNKLETALNPLYLPTHIQSPDISGRWIDDSSPNNDFTHWFTWQNLITIEKENHQLALMTPNAHQYIPTSRVKYLLKLRLSYFPFSLACWVEWIQWIEHYDQNRNEVIHELLEMIKIFPLIPLPLFMLTNYNLRKINKHIESIVASEDQLRYKCFISKLKKALADSVSKLKNITYSQGNVSPIFSKNIKESVEYIKSLFITHLVWMQWANKTFSNKNELAIKVIARHALSESLVSQEGSDKLISESSVIKMFIQFTETLSSAIIKINNKHNLNEHSFVYKMIETAVGTVSLYFNHFFIQWIKLTLEISPLSSEEKGKNVLYIYSGWIALLRDSIVPKLIQFPNDMKFNIVNSSFYEVGRLIYKAYPQFNNAIKEQFGILEDIVNGNSTFFHNNELNKLKYWSNEKTQISGTQPPILLNTNLLEYIKQWSQINNMESTTLDCKVNNSGTKSLTTLPLSLNNKSIKKSEILSLIHPNFKKWKDAAEVISDLDNVNLNARTPTAAYKLKFSTSLMSKPLLDSYSAKNINSSNPISIDIYKKYAEAIKLDQLNDSNLIPNIDLINSKFLVSVPDVPLSFTETSFKSLPVFPNTFNYYTYRRKSERENMQYKYQNTKFISEASQDHDLASDANLTLIPSKNDAIRNFIEISTYNPRMQGKI